ncbi:hypothetical protein ACHAPU_009465 [Fusarium lateritium]
MDPTPTNISTFMYPTAVFTRNPPMEPEVVSVDWSKSTLNPKNRINSLEPLPQCDWIIQGADLAGTRWFAVPNFAIGKPPLRIDVHVPELFNTPGYLRDVLEPNSPMFGELETAGNSHIAVHISRALHWWSSRRKDFSKEYLELPFGSRIVFGTMTHDIRQLNIQLAPVYDIERQWLSIKALRDMWELPESRWPSVVDFDSLQFRRRLHDTIDVVSIEGHGQRQFIFKSLMNDVKYLYHEIKTLIAMKPHVNVIQGPVHLVKKRCGFGGRRGICGMILPFHPSGTLRRWLKERPHVTAENYLPTQIAWAKQIISALMHIQSSGPGYYTNLKLDNIVVDDSDRSDIPKLVIIDFEQRLGSPVWTPPEVHSVTFLADLVHHDPHSSTSRKYRDILHQCGIAIPESERAVKYVNPEAGYSHPWSILNPQQREAAQVFMLGKLLWCLFENSSLLNSYIGINSFRDNYSEKVFPEFVSTPEPLRKCILRCTAGSWESRGRAPPLLARGRKIILRDDQNRVNHDNLENIQATIRKWWRQQIVDAESFLQRRFTGVEEDCCATRPRLHEVLEVLEGIQRSLV